MGRRILCHSDPPWAGKNPANIVSDAKYNISMKEYFVYILTNFTNSVFYVGITNDINRRVWEHKNKKSINSFTGKYNIYKLVWYEMFPTSGEAILIEKRMKGWTRVKKIKLIKSKNPNFDDITALRA